MYFLFFITVWVLGAIAGCEITTWVLKSMSHEDFMYVLDCLTHTRINRAKLGKIEKENYLKKSK